MKKSQRTLSVKALAFAAILALAASPAAADFVINDDLIVDGSACIGFDCVNGESFGFDTIRLKENNLRIKFDDTSVAASFPRNDWQLTANDSANGGASKFSIDDISGNRTPFTVEANARNNSLYVDDGGRIGSRTSTPSTEIHTVDGDTPTLRLQQDGSSGFAPQTWDVAGNETNFFIRDVTNGSTLPFRIRPGAPTSSIFVDVDGTVGIGTASPALDNAGVHVKSTNDTTAASVGIGVDASAAGNCAMNLQYGPAQGHNFITARPCSGNERMRMFVGATETMTLLTTGVNITGDLTVSGDCTEVDGACADFVFKPSYELESIEEHAKLMWENSYLPEVGPASATGFSVGRKTTGILHELEKAHIYIEQLNETVVARDAVISELLERVERLEQQ